MLLLLTALILQSFCRRILQLESWVLLLQAHSSTTHSPSMQAACARQDGSCSANAYSAEHHWKVLCCGGCVFAFHGLLGLRPGTLNDGIVPWMLFGSTFHGSHACPMDVELMVVMMQAGSDDHLCPVPSQLSSFTWAGRACQLACRCQKACS